MKTRFTYDCAAAYSEPRLSFFAKLAALLREAITTARIWLRRRRDRRDPLCLSDHMLRDIGLDRSRADTMATRPFRRA